MNAIWLPCKIRRAASQRLGSNKNEVKIREGFSLSNYIVCLSYIFAIIGQIRARTMSFGASFYPNCLSEWNKLDSEIRQLPTLGMFKKKLFSLIHPLPQPVYSIQDPKGFAILTQLRVGLSKLNLHKFKHNFKDTVNPMCSINDGIQDTEHFLLLCHSYDSQSLVLLLLIMLTPHAAIVLIAGFWVSFWSNCAKSLSEIILVWGQLDTSSLIDGEGFLYLPPGKWSCNGLLIINEHMQLITSKH